MSNTNLLSVLLLLPAQIGISSIGQSVQGTHSFCSNNSFICWRICKLGHNTVPLEEPLLSLCVSSSYSVWNGLHNKNEKEKTLSQHLHVNNGNMYLIIYCICGIDPKVDRAQITEILEHKKLWLVVVYSNEWLFDPSLSQCPIAMKGPHEHSKKGHLMGVCLQSTIVKGSMTAHMQTQCWRNS